MKFINAKEDVLLDTELYKIGKVTAVYANATTLYAVVTFAKEIENVMFSINGPDGSPRDQVTNFYAQYPYSNDPKKVCFFIKGGGFVSGHVIAVNYFAKFK